MQGGGQLQDDVPASQPGLSLALVRNTFLIVVYLLVFTKTVLKVISRSALWTREGRTSISSGWPPVSIMWTISSTKLSGIVGAVDLTSGTIFWHDGLDLVISTSLLHLPEALLHQLHQNNGSVRPGV